MHLCMHAYRYLVFGKNIFVLFSMSLQVQGRQESEGSEILVQCKCLLSHKYSAFFPHRKWNKLKRVAWRGWAAQSAIAQDVFSTTCQAAQRQAQVEHDLQACRFNLHTTCSHAVLICPKQALQWFIWQELAARLHVPPVPRPLPKACGAQKKWAVTSPWDMPGRELWTALLFLVGQSTSWL